MPGPLSVTAMLTTSPRRSAKTETLFLSGSASAKGIVGEAVVAARVVYDKGLSRFNDVAAERHLPRRLWHIKPIPRLEPLPVGVDERHKTNGNAGDVGGEAGEGVEAVFGGGVDDLVGGERTQPVGLVVR